MNIETKALTWGVVIVAFNPNLADFEKKIDGISMVTENLVIINNGDDFNISNKHVRLINLHENKGIAYAQNVGAKILKEIGVSLLFFFDQDSVYDNTYFERMLIEWVKLNNEDENIGILSPNIIDDKFKFVQGFLTLTDDGIKKSVLNQDEYKIIKNTLPISSGILVSKDAYFAVGGVKDSFFIDFVDFELDLNLLKHGYSIYSISNIFIEHAIGEKNKRHFLFKAIYPSNHPIFRGYYTVRNGIYVYRMYGDRFKGLKKLILKSLFVRTICAFYEENKLKRLNSIFKGIRDGVRTSLQKFS